MNESWTREAIQSRMQIADLCTRISTARLAIKAKRPTEALNILQRALDDAQRHLRNVETLQSQIENRSTFTTSALSTNSSRP